MIEAIIGIGTALYIMFVFSCCVFYIFVRYSVWHWTTKTLMTILFLPVFALILPIVGGLLMAQKYIEVLEK